MNSDPVLGGRYRLIGQVGSGGMAVVWQAYDTVLARTVAVKVLAAHYADDPESRALIRQEARSAAALSHPNIAQVHDYGEENTVPYVVMELIRGGTLQQRLADGPVLPRFAMRIGAEVAAALAAAHAEGLVHRDIKPANVMLAPTGAKVVDFGIAAAIRPPGSGAGDLLVIGTPAYLAPERLLHDAVEPASDVYALGVLLYRLLAGHSPWTIETTTEMLSAHIYVDPAPLTPMFTVPAEVSALCDRCLSKDPALRPSAREVAVLLAHGAGLPIVTDEPVAAPGGPAVDPEPSVLIRPQVQEPAGEGAGAASVDQGPVFERPAGREGPGFDGSEPAPGPGSADGVTRARRIRPRHVAGAAALVVAAAAAGWVLHQAGPASTEAAPPSGPASPSAQHPRPGGPATAPASASAATGPAAPLRTAASPVEVPGTAAGPGVTAPPASGPAEGGPAATGPAGIGPATPGPATTGPAPDPTTGDPGPPDTPAPPAERTLSSSAGSVRALCPAADTARIRSWTAARSYQVVAGDSAAGPAPTVIFRHGNTQVTMTVSCEAGVPSASTS